MPEFWMDADSFITPHRGPYRFDLVPQFWEFLRQKAVEGIIASPEIVLTMELSADEGDEQDVLEQWAKPLKGIMFLSVDEAIQNCNRDVVAYVQGNGQYKQHWKDWFLSQADPWVIAYAMARGGRIVTFETPQPQAQKPKIPDVAGHFGIKRLSVYDMLTELDAHF